MCVLAAAAFLATDFRAVSAADLNVGHAAARPGLSVEGDRSVIRGGGGPDFSLTAVWPRRSKEHRLVIGEGKLRLDDDTRYLRFRVRLLAKPREAEGPFEVWRSVIATSDRPVKGIGALVETRCRTDLRFRTSVQGWWRNTTADSWNKLTRVPLRTGPAWFNRCR